MRGKTSSPTAREAVGACGPQGGDLAAEEGRRPPESALQAAVGPGRSREVLTRAELLPPRHGRAARGAPSWGLRGQPHPEKSERSRPSGLCGHAGMRRPEFALEPGPRGRWDKPRGPGDRSH